jgi:hypothetical protein
MHRRRTGQIAAGLGALISFGWATWAARASAMPELKVYDGYWMMLGAAVAILLVAPVVWRWPRDRSLIAVAVAAAVGCVLPLVISAWRLGLPVAARLRGSWVLGGADLVGPALIIGSVCLWFALREYEPRSPRPTAGSR